MEALQDEFRKPYFAEIAKFVAEERAGPSGCLAPRWLAGSPAPIITVVFVFTQIFITCSNTFNLLISI